MNEEQILMIALVGIHAVSPDNFSLSTGGRFGFALS